MSPVFLLSLAAVVAVLLGARVLLPALPIRGRARRLSQVDAVLAGAGLAGLAFHCLAMFFRRTVEWVPGADAVTADIRSLGTASIIWYVVPAVLVLVGLRHQHPGALAVVAVALTAVGVTMYDGGPLQTHLGAIFGTVLVFALVSATVVLPPWGPEPQPTRRRSA